jgi:hypothetical protein
MYFLSFNNFISRTSIDGSLITCACEEKDTKVWQKSFQTVGLSTISRTSKTVSEGFEVIEISYVDSKVTKRLNVWLLFTTVTKNEIQMAFIKLYEMSEF